MPLPKVYDWKRALQAMEVLAEAFPEEFPTWVLIGGAACWYYRERLHRARDVDFQPPPYDAQQEQVWLSKDIDFMGLTEDEAVALFQAPFDPETHTIPFRGLEVDFLEEGVRLDISTAHRNADLVQTPDVSFLVITADVLYAEKCGLIQIKDRPQDRLHHALLAEFLKYEFCAEAENQATLEARDWVARARALKTCDHDFFTRDLRLVRRLQAALAKLDSPDHRPLHHWAKHHLPA